MTTPRRSLLASLALAPLAGVASVAGAATAPLPVDPERSEADWLEFGARNTDAAFASLCDNALRAAARSKSADVLFDDALNAARAATPDFPAPLVMQMRMRDAQGVVSKEWTENWSPDADKRGAVSFLWHLAHREAQARGVSYSKSLEDDLRAQYDAWTGAKDAARDRFMVCELSADSDAAAIAAGGALTAVLNYQPRNAEALLIKLHLCGIRYGVEDDNDASVELPAGRFSALVADVARVLAS